MTLLFPEKTIGDRILKILGRRRAVYYGDGDSSLGPYAMYRMSKEPFLKALFLSPKRKLKAGWVFIDDVPNT